MIERLEIMTCKDRLKALVVVQLGGEQREVCESSAMSQAALRKNGIACFPCPLQTGHNIML